MRDDVVQELAAEERLHLVLAVERERVQRIRIVVDAHRLDRARRGGDGTPQSISIVRGSRAERSVACGVCSNGAFVSARHLP